MEAVPTLPREGEMIQGAAKELPRPYDLSCEPAESLDTMLDQGGTNVSGRSEAAAVYCRAMLRAIPPSLILMTPPPAVELGHRGSHPCLHCMENPGGQPP